MIIRNKFNGYVNGNNRLYPGGGGGSQPTNTTQTTTTIPEYARPYVERMLGKAEAFSETPYQPYGGQRTAEFSPLQEQAFQGAANLGPAKQLGVGTQMAGIAGLGGLGAGQQYAQQATNPYAMQAYMSPYIESAMAPQLREAARASAIQGQQNQAQAVQQGAFGGARSAIVEAERQRNLAQQQGDIYGRGMQTAYEQARQAQQFGADLGLRGYGMAGQMAGTLGQLGQTQFGQQQGAIQAQAAAGAQQQAQEQQKLTQAYQDFLTQRGYPQQQLAFMSDILRGVPLGQQTQVQYQAPPPMASQLAQLGLGAYGVSQMMKKDGGVIKMAEGGIADAAPDGYNVPPEKLMGMMKGMSAEQLQTVGENAKNAVTLGLVQAEMAKRQAMENGQILAQSVPEGTVKDAMMGIDQVPIDERMFADTAVGEYVPEEPAQAPAEEPVMRGGGIVAFAKGKEVKEKDTPSASASDGVSSTTKEDIAALRAMKPEEAFDTPEERRTNIKEGVSFMKELMGPDKTIEMAEKIAKAAELGPEAESRAKAATAFEMMAMFGEPVPFATAAGRAGAVAGRGMREYEKLKREADAKANEIRLNTARYERAEQRGNVAEGMKIARELQQDKKDLYTLRSAQTASLVDTGIKADQMAQTAQLTREQMANALRIAEMNVAATIKAAGISASRPDINIEALKGEIAGRVADHMRANGGRQPDAMEMAKIRQAAVGTILPQLRPSYGLGADKLDLTRRDKILEYMDTWRNSSAGSRALRDAAREDKKANRDPSSPGSLTYQLEKRKFDEYSAFFGADQPTAQTAPQIARPTTREEYDKLPKGAEYVAPDGTRRVKQ